MTQSDYRTLADGQLAYTYHEAGTTFANCKLPIVVVHGHGGDATAARQGFQFDAAGAMRALSKAGFAVCSIDAGGVASWGGPAAQTKIAAAIANPIARSKVGIIGYSMGGVSVLNYLKNNAAKVAACWLWEPCTDLTWAFNNAAAPSWATEINTSYGSFAATAGSRIADEYATWRGLGIPIKVVHASDDTVIPASQSAAFIAGVNDPLVTLRTPAPTGDHTGVFPNIPAAETVQFFEAGLAGSLP